MEINSLVLRNRAGACYCVWEADGNQYGCRLDGRLGRLGSPLQLNVRPRTNAVSGCMRGDGSVVLVWTAGDDSVLRTLDRQGQLLGDELVVQADPAGSQLSPHIALGPGGRLAVGWYETAPGQGSPATARVALFVPIDGAREDCNGNGVEDSGDVTLGTSSDRDENGVPDECQGGMQLTGDCDQDGTLNMADALCLLGILFLGEPAELPCSDGLPDDSGNILLFAQSPPRPLRVTDAIRVIRFLFVPDLAVPESRALGRCVPVPGCLDSAACR